MCDSSEEHLHHPTSDGVGASGDRKAQSFCMRGRWWIRPIAMTLYGLFVVIAVPLLVYNSLKDGFSRDDQLILIGGLFVLSAIPLSVWHIMQHMMHFTKPVLQKHIVRILWMVPIYALNAWLGLIFYEQSFYMDCVREIYEAYVIYNFMVYLLNYLNLEMDLERSLEDKPQQPHMFPVCYIMQPWRMGRDFVHNCKHGIMQYTVLRLFTTFISIICEVFGVYGESTFRADVAYPYIVAINNVSQCTAMYCLVLFYKANREELLPMKPLPKFLCIKAVIFFSFFQSVIITGLVYYGIVRNIFGATDASDADHRNLSSKLQDFLICIEMFIAALAHKYSFPHQPFHINIPNYTVSSGRTWLESCLAMCDVSDVHADVSDHFGVLGSSMVRRLRGRSNYQLTRGAEYPSPTEADRLIPSSTTSTQQYQQHSTAGKQSAQQAPAATGATQRTAAHHNRYGTVAAPTTSAATGGGHINIVKHPTAADAHKEYSPQFGGGAPRVGGQFFGAAGSCSVGGGASSMSLLNDERSARTTTTTSNTAASTSTKATSGSSTSSSHRDGGGVGGGRVDTFTGLTTGAEAGMRKSDSAASDWLSTPTDEMIGIDVSGPDADLIRLQPDPRV